MVRLIRARNRARTEGRSEESTSGVSISGLSENRRIAMPSFRESTDIPSIFGETGERIVIAIRISPLAVTVSGICTWRHDQARSLGRLASNDHSATATPFAVNETSSRL